APRCRSGRRFAAQPAPAVGRRLTGLWGAFIRIVALSSENAQAFRSTTRPDPTVVGSGRGGGEVVAFLRTGVGPADARGGRGGRAEPVGIRGRGRRVPPEGRGGSGPRPGGGG